jgi:hypothetical protein
MAASQIEALAASFSIGWYSKAYSCITNCRSHPIQRQTQDFFFYRAIRKRVVKAKHGERGVRDAALPLGFLPILLLEVGEVAPCKDVPA